MSKKRKTIGTLTTDESKRYFICGTVGELTMSVEVDEMATFELIPEEQMRVFRNEKDGHLWLADDSDDKCRSRAAVCDGKVAMIEFSPSCENLMSMLIAAKENSLQVRVVARMVTPGENVSLCALSIM